MCWESGIWNLQLPQKLQECAINKASEQSSVGEKQGLLGQLEWAGCESSLFERIK